MPPEDPASGGGDGPPSRPGSISGLLKGLQNCAPIPQCQRCGPPPPHQPDPGSPLLMACNISRDKTFRSFINFCECLTFLQRGEWEMFYLPNIYVRTVMRVCTARVRGKFPQRSVGPKTRSTGGAGPRSRRRFWVESRGRNS